MWGCKRKQLELEIEIKMLTLLQEVKIVKSLGPVILFTTKAS
jgi:hypothetical protein